MERGSHRKTTDHGNRPNQQKKAGDHSGRIAHSGNLHAHPAHPEHAEQHHGVDHLGQATLTETTMAGSENHLAHPEIQPTRQQITLLVKVVGALNRAALRITEVYRKDSIAADYVPP